MDEDTNKEVNADDVAVFEEMFVNEDKDMNVEQYMVKDEEMESLEIFAIKIRFKKSSLDFHGACVDSGAQKTVFGNDKAETYFLQVGDRKSLMYGKSHGENRFRYRSREHKCKGILNICMPRWMT